MGLDMYLEAEVYIPRWEHSSGLERRKAGAALDAAGLTAMQVENAGVTVTATAMYWRKANAVHAWFVTNVQEGRDDCAPHYVTREQLETLRDLCQKVLDGSELVPDMVTNGQTLVDGVMKNNQQMGKQVLNSDLARELLPAAAGFFFGGTDYDEWYIRDLEATAKGLTRVLELEGIFDFHYRSSW